MKPFTFIILLLLTVQAYAVHPVVEGHAIYYGLPDKVNDSKAEEKVYAMARDACIVLAKSTHTFITMIGEFQYTSSRDDFLKDIRTVKAKFECIRGW